MAHKPKGMKKVVAILTSQQKSIVILFLVIIVINVSSTIFGTGDTYTRKDFWQRFSNLKVSYETSQYVSKHPKGWIPDEIVNAYAGGAYVRGVSPIFIGADTPPLGRYFIGLSAVLFENENTANLLFAIGSLILIYAVARKVCKTTIASLIPVVFFSTEPIFKNQLIYTPLLDIIQLFFLLSFFYIFILAFENKKRQIRYFAIASLLLGAFISVKFFATGITLVAASVSLLLIYKRFRAAVSYVFTLILSIGVLLLSYVNTLFTGTGISNYLGIQKWVFLYHKSQLILPFSIWSLLLLNKWYVWWGDKPVIADNQWQITWPIITIGAILIGIFILIKRLPRSPLVELLLLWSGFYLLFFSFGQITSRYLVILLPIFYIINAYGVENVITAMLKRRS